MKWARANPAGGSLQTNASRTVARTQPLVVVRRTSKLSQLSSVNDRARVETSADRGRSFCRQSRPRRRRGLSRSFRNRNLFQIGSFTT
jgi:hypothetical protein